VRGADTRRIGGRTFLRDDTRQRGVPRVERELRTNSERA